MRVLGEFHRTGEGIERRFTNAERRMLRTIGARLAADLDAAGDPDAVADPVIQRLLPDAFPTDPEASAEFADATRERLASAKSDGVRRLTADLEQAPGGVVRLDEAGAVVWLKALGDLRLSLAERIGIDEVQRDVRSPQGLLYAWLTWLQGSLVDVVDTD